MARSGRLRQFLGAAVSLLLARSASAIPTEVHIVEQREVAHGAPSPWVSVDSSGKATTITPTVTSVNGAATTISPPPEALTKTGTYTLSPTSAAVTTSTGLSPVATASSSNGDGVFLACSIYQGVDEPFCQPKSGSQLSPGKTYYVTWSESYFSNTSTTIQIQGTYHTGSDDNTGFTSPRMLASKGFYVWTIPATILSSHTPSPLSSMNVSLTLAYFQDLYGNDVEDVPGPTVIVTGDKAADSSSGAGSGSARKSTVTAIVVPLAVLIPLLLLAAICFGSWRRHGTVPVLGALRRRAGGGGGGKGYGVRQSRAERVGGGGAFGTTAQTMPGGVDDKKAGGVELTDRDSWSPGGRNVFREEMARQERER